ncbi:MAG: hypothetical protein ACYDCL_17790 [Myxococcales bacterium]
MSDAIAILIAATLASTGEIPPQHRLFAPYHLRLGIPERTLSSDERNYYAQHLAVLEEAVAQALPCPVGWRVRKIEVLTPGMELAQVMVCDDHAKMKFLDLSIGLSEHARPEHWDAIERMSAAPDENCTKNCFHTLASEATYAIAELKPRVALAGRDAVLLLGPNLWQIADAGLSEPSVPTNDPAEQLPAIRRVRSAVLQLDENGQWPVTASALLKLIPIDPILAAWAAIPLPAAPRCGMPAVGTPLAGSERDADEMAVDAAVVELYHAPSAVIPRTVPIGALSESERSELVSHLPCVDHALVDDFATRAERAHALKTTARVPEPLKVLARDLPRPDFPTTRLSRVGFSRDGARALLLLETNTFAPASVRPVIFQQSLHVLKKQAAGWTEVWRVVCQGKCFSARE